MITPNFILRQHEIKRQVLFRRSGMLAIACLSYYDVFISVSCQYNVFLEDLFTMGLKYSRILHNMNLHISLLSPSKSSVLRDYCCSLPATKGSNTE